VIIFHERGQLFPAQLGLFRELWARFRDVGCTDPLVAFRLFFFFFWASPASDPPASPLPVVGSPGRCARCARSAVAGIQTPALRHALSQLTSMVHSPPIGSGVLSGRYLISYDMRAAHRLKTLMHYYERSMYCRFLSCRFLVCIPQQLTR
jgi:hypothetical protein